MPNYNNAPFLKECLDSIINQTYKNFELVIIDDGSTDQSLDIIDNYNDNRFHVIKKEHNSGIIDSLNIGLEYIKSEYIVRMDGDDKMNVKRLEKLVCFMDNNSNIGVCGSAIQHFGISNETIIYPTNPELNNANLIFSHSIGHASIILRNSIIKKHKIRYSSGYKFMEDYKLFYDLSKVTLTTSIPDVLYYYRREEYNNFKNLEIKKIGYKKVYLDILKMLKFKSPDKHTILHFELGRLHNFTHTLAEYNSHLNKLISNNNENKIFPIHELEIIINDIKNKLFYKLIDNNTLSIIEGIP